jgi:hypothetical protein
VALRRRTPPYSSPVVTRLRDLITNDQVALLGAIRPLICTREQIPYKIVEIEIADREAAISWMYKT